MLAVSKNSLSNAWEASKTAVLRSLIFIVRVCDFFGNSIAKDFGSNLSVFGQASKKGGFYF